MAIAGFIKTGASVVDVGTDHGLLPVYLAQNDIARHIIASDISAGSLEAARRSANKYGVADKITFVVAAGLDGVHKTDVDTVVVAGLGGETIAGILAKAGWTREQAVNIVLQPQTKVGELCAWLREGGYTIHDAALSLDGGKYYVIICIAGGKSDSILEPEIELLARLMHKRDPLFPEYLDDLIARTGRALKSMESAKPPEILNMALRLSVYTGLKEANEKWQEQ